MAGVDAAGAEPISARAEHRGEHLDLQPVYGIARERRLEERAVPRLPGYRGMGPVRVGNDNYRMVRRRRLRVALACGDE